MKKNIICLSLLLSLAQLLVFAQKEQQVKEKENFSPTIFSSFKFRSIGPAVTGGRISDFAVHPLDRSIYYVAVSSGNVWKTTNAGTSWTAIFDNQGSYSIGCITLDPNNSHTVWVGTGENNSQRSVGYGDGVYRSDDDGSTWKNMGLKKSEHISKIFIDPRNSNIIYVACQGPLWSAGGERGIYKSTDGGNTWNLSLFISENTGVNDLSVDPRNSDVLYASSYQRRRHVFTLIDGGPESAIYKTTNGGSNWKKLTNGLPSEDMGKIGLSVSPVNPDVVYASIEAANKSGGFFRSTNCGASWEKRSDYVANPPMYYQEIFSDPKDVDRVYAMDVYVMCSDDGGKSFQRLNTRNVHVDHHALWIDPKNINYYLLGNDGGIYESFDRGENWNFKSNLPIAQFYRVSTDNSEPFYSVFGGTQDNASLGAPSRTTNISGIVNSDWFITTGGDGFKSQVDPTNPNILYAQSQHGGLVRYDRKSGEEIGIRPIEDKGESAYRWNWDAPLIISTHLNSRLYFGSNKVFRSDDFGNSWKIVSPDLTKQIDRNKQSVMGKVWGMDAVAKHGSTAAYGNISYISESPLKEGLIFVGTDDGLIQITEDGGVSWNRIDKFPNIPELAYVSSVYASNHNTKFVYASFDNHKNGDFSPYLLKSEDGGKQWKSIKGNLPDKGNILSFAEDHINPNLLFIGTEFGFFFSIDCGNKWIQIKNGLPTIPVRDIAIQKRENDLVLATFGRGIFILDDYTPLRLMTKDVLEKECTLFPIKNALLFLYSNPIGSKKGTLGESYFTADNPPFGAIFSYYYRESFSTRKQKRLANERELSNNNMPITMPSLDSLKAEDSEESPYLEFTITDEMGNIVRKLRNSISAGINKVIWDLRYPSNVSAIDQDDSGGGVLVAPGTYKVSIAKVVNGISTDLKVYQTFLVIPLTNSNMSVKDRKELVEFQKKSTELNRVVNETGEVVREISTRIKIIKSALKKYYKATKDLVDKANTIEKQIIEISTLIYGDNSASRLGDPVPPSFISRVGKMVYDGWQSTSLPTGTQKSLFSTISDELPPILKRLKSLINDDLKTLENMLDEKGVPWTPGRFPSFKFE